MPPLNFPDINVWLALAAPEHVHHGLARRWWERESGVVAFTRLTQLGFLRLLTNASVMAQKPLTMSKAWRIYDRFFEDDRVVFVDEPPGVEAKFRSLSGRTSASPKVWADAWLLAFASTAEGRLVTFDRALEAKGASCLLPA